MARSIVVRNSGRNGGRNGGRSGEKNGGRNGARSGGRNGSDIRVHTIADDGGRNGSDVRVHTTTDDNNDIDNECDGTNIRTPTQDVPVGNNGTSTEDVIVGNNAIPNVDEVVMETNVGNDTEQTQNSSGAVRRNEAANGVRTSMYQHLHAKRSVNGRQVIQVFANELFPSCARSIKKIFENRIDISGYNWENVTRETKKFYFEELRKRYHWDEAIEELVKIAWDKKASKRYNEMTCKANKGKKKLEFVPQNIWDEWQKYFCSEEFLRKSAKNSKNRLKNGAGPSCHTGGSISHVEHAIRYANELGRDPTHYELFLKTHTRKDGQTLVDDKAREINERVIDLKQQHLEQLEDNPKELDESQIFIEAAKGKRRDRIYGIGAVANLQSSNRAATFAPPPSNDYTAQLEKQVETLKQDFGTMREELNQLRQERTLADEQRFRELIREMVPNLATNQTRHSDESRSSDSQP